MEYKCRVKAELNSFADGYNIILYYKTKFQLKSTKYDICMSYWRNSNDNEDFLEVVKKLNSMSDGDFMDYIKNIIAREESEKLKEKQRNYETYEEINKLNRKGKFTIKI